MTRTKNASYVTPSPTSSPSRINEDTTGTNTPPAEPAEPETSREEVETNSEDNASEDNASENDSCDDSKVCIFKMCTTRYYIV